MPSVFISHSSEERELATHLAEWLEKSLPTAKCYCSSRPSNLPPGREWLKDIFEHAKNSDLCLMLLSPYSANNSWLHFEAGLVLGAAEISDNRIIPVLYAGITERTLPPTIRHIQYLSLEDSSNFDAFISEHFLKKGKPTTKQNHGDFRQSLSPEAFRVLKYGWFGSWITEKVLTEKGWQIISLKGDKDRNADSFIKKRYSDHGELVAVRAKIIPRRLSGVNHWKFGVTLLKQNQQANPERIFQFHSGCHEGLNSWTVYFSSTGNHHTDTPARIETERPSILELWLSRDKSSVACIGVDSDGRYEVLINDRAESLWRLSDNSWNEVIVSAWADGYPFHIDIIDFEIDRIPRWDTTTLSWVGGMNPENPLIVVLNRFGD